VIIMSTVRSSEESLKFDLRHNLGFVANPRKFNGKQVPLLFRSIADIILVAITRSQALLIIVGNPRTLSIDPMWRYFLNYVYNNGGWRGPVPDWNTNAEVDLSGGYDKAMHQQAQLDMNEFTRRMESLTMGGIDDDGAGVHLREE
jgi:helicase MOV-10